jgi:hypothetical protein
MNQIKMKQIITTLAIIIAAASITSCKKTATTTTTNTSKSIVGYWKGTHAGNSAFPIAQYVFNANGSMLYYDDADSNKVDSRWSGTYGINNGIITMNYSVFANGVTYNQEETATLSSDYKSFTGTWKALYNPIFNGTTSATKH